MGRSITNRLNTIIGFLTDIENYDIIISSISDFNNELIKIDII